MKCMSSYSMHIEPFSVIFNSDKEHSLVLCATLFCSIGFLLVLLFRQFSRLFLYFFFLMSDLFSLIWWLLVFFFLHILL